MKIPDDIVEMLEQVRPQPFEWLSKAVDTTFREISDPEKLCRNPLVSVQMVTYNHSAYIKQAVESVLSQACDFDFELLLSDDCSTDGSWDICRALQKQHSNRLRLFNSGKNVGGVANVYRLQNYVRGKYLAFCDGDDYWHNPRKLAEQIKALTANPDCGLTFSMFDVLHEKSGTLNHDVGNAGSDNTLFLSKDETLRAIIEHSIIPLTATVMVKTELYLLCLNTYDLLKKKYSMSDTQLWAACAYHSSLFYVNQSFATYRRVETSMTQTANLNKRLTFQLDDLLMMIGCVKSFIRDEHLQRILYRWCLRLFTKRILTVLDQCGDLTLKKKVMRVFKHIAKQGEIYSVGDKCQLFSVEHPWFIPVFKGLSLLYRNLR